MLRKWSTVWMRPKWYDASPSADQPLDPEDLMTPQTARRLAFALAPVLGATALAVQPAAAVTAPPQRAVARANSPATTITVTNHTVVAPRWRLRLGVARGAAGGATARSAARERWNDYA